jgi:hypothetical protein
MHDEYSLMIETLTLVVGEIGSVASLQTPHLI